MMGCAADEEDIPRVVSFSPSPLETENALTCCLAAAATGVYLTVLRIADMIVFVYVVGEVVVVEVVVVIGLNGIE
jgi:hypothetical protein